MAEVTMRVFRGDGSGIRADNRGEQDADLLEAADRSKGAENVILLSTIHCPLSTWGEVPWWRR